MSDKSSQVPSKMPCGAADLTWTPTPPPVPGWWWFRPVVESVARPVPAKFAVVVCVHSEHGFLWVGATRPRRLDTFDPRSLWAGPLTPPAACRPSGGRWPATWPGPTTPGSW